MMGFIVDDAKKGHRNDYDRVKRLIADGLSMLNAAKTSLDTLTTNVAADGNLDATYAADLQTLKDDTNASLTALAGTF